MSLTLYTNMQGGIHNFKKIKLNHYRAGRLYHKLKQYKEEEKNERN